MSAPGDAAAGLRRESCRERVRILNELTDKLRRLDPEAGGRIADEARFVKIVRALVETAENLIPALCELADELDGLPGGPGAPDLDAGAVRERLDELESVLLPRLARYLQSRAQTDAPGDI